MVQRSARGRRTFREDEESAGRSIGRFWNKNKLTVEDRAGTIQPVLTERRDAMPKGIATGEADPAGGGPGDRIVLDTVFDPCPQTIFTPIRPQVQ